MPDHGIQVITFDTDGTIWDAQTTMRQALAASLTDLQERFPEAAGSLSVNDLIDHRQEAEAAFSGQSMTMESLRFAGFVRTLDAIGIRDESAARDLARTYLERRFAGAQVFDDAPPTLDILQQHFKLGLLTSGNSYPDRLGLGDRFDFTVIAQEHGVRKLDPAFYELAVQMAGTDPARILHVGDSLDNDVRPARRAGMQVVWLNRKGIDPPSGRQAVATLYSLRELPAFLSIPGA